ncbi:uncharacterized protein Dwil_GK16494 [Drosophila willistoni]|uniref:Uncharacterized protein n=1 Tax=Drosophila willistoni TaxID=7260 RepID=B4N2F5_DROWI|nr:uncharacterized protein Dwil_GK16494 [Drosophila willistoni]
MMMVLIVWLVMILGVIVSLSEAYNLPLPMRRNIIKVRASGFLPFESDLLLPLGILRQLQHAQDRASRSRHVLPHQHRTTKLKKKPKQQVRLERTKSLPGMQMYNLIDDDGELLLNLRVHNDGVKGAHGADKDPHTDTDVVPAAASFRNSIINDNDNGNESPWLPSKWRPTTERSAMAMGVALGMGFTSSSPKPLPLHQYLTSNHLGEAERRSFKPQKVWPYK